MLLSGSDSLDLTAVTAALIRLGCWQGNKYMNDSNMRLKVTPPFN